MSVSMDYGDGEHGVCVCVRVSLCVCMYVCQNRHAITQLAVRAWMKRERIKSDSIFVCEFLLVSLFLFYLIFILIDLRCFSVTVRIHATLTILDNSMLNIHVICNLFGIIRLGVEAGDSVCVCVCVCVSFDVHVHGCTRKHVDAYTAGVVNNLVWQVCVVDR